MEIKRAYKYRVYPTKSQEVILARTFGCTRYIYNYMLRLRTDAWFERGEYVGYHKTSALLTKLKQQEDHAWLRGVSSVPTQQSLQHLQRAFNNFFAKRAKYPSRKTKRGRQSATYVGNGFVWDGGTLTLAKMKEPLVIRWSRPIPKKAKITTCTVSKDAAGRYFVSLLCSLVVGVSGRVGGEVGVDLGLSHFATLSTGEKIAAPNASRKYEKRLAKLQKNLARKQKGSKNRAKARLKVAKIHAKITDTRVDFLHKVSTKLIRENQTIAIETLSVINMIKNKHLSKSIADAGWGEFVRQLNYKADWYGRNLIGISRWYPSSKRCASCGFVLDRLSLSCRNWTCPECGVTHDRDVNAACNILAAGHAVAALGEAVSPEQVCA